MYNLFLETRAAAQVSEWCRRKEIDDAELLQSAYNNACKCDMWANDPGGFSGFLVARALQDRHRDIDIDYSFMWANTPEGKDFWRKVNRMIVPLIKKFV